MVNPNTPNARGKLKTQIFHLYYSASVEMCHTCTHMLQLHSTKVNQVSPNVPLVLCILNKQV